MASVSAKRAYCFALPLPWKPTSVNLVASTFMKGACDNLASRLAISVFPTPVGPIIKMFFGIISFACAGGSFLRLQRFPGKRQKKNPNQSITYGGQWPPLFWLPSARQCACPIAQLSLVDTREPLRKFVTLGYERGMKNLHHPLRCLVFV